MSAKSIIRRKRDGEELSADELHFFVRGSLDGTIPEYQVTAWLMAIFFQSMTRPEAAALTRSMIQSGEQIKLPKNQFVPVDKHSTGGVGDKLSFLVAPLVAAAGGRVPMVSGRSLGHTGGTLDKMESIPSFSTRMSPAGFVKCVEELGFAMAGQTDNMVPADRLFYSLRDSASIVESIPLITASILSKKVAEGAEALVLDVKVGNGAFMTQLDDARELAEWLVQTARVLGVRARALITDMDRVLGRTAGNALEIVESVEALRAGPDKTSADIRELTLALGGAMLELSGIEASPRVAREKIEAVWRSGAGLRKFRDVVEWQGGDAEAVDDLSRLPHATQIVPVTAPTSGMFLGLSARPVGDWITESGGGRLKTSDVIHPVVGVRCRVDAGEHIVAGTPLFELHLQDSTQFELEALLTRAQSWVEMGDAAPSPRWLETIDADD